MKGGGADLNKVRGQLKDELRKIPSVSGSGADAGQTYVTQRLNRVLTRGEQEAGKLKDAYVSIEHVLIALLDQPVTTAKILRENRLTHDNLMDTTNKLPVNQRVP